MKGLLEGTVEPSRSLSDLFDDCLSCYACRTVCPAGVETERLWIAARQDLSEISSTGRLKKIAFRSTIGKPSLFELGVRLASFLFGFDPQDRFETGVPWGKGRPFRGAPYLHRMKDEYTPSSQPAGTVGLLVGCSNNLITPWILDSTVKVLTASGWRVIVPKDQVCCGAPAINNGDWETARRLAIHNVEVFGGLGVDFITSPDATCAGAFARDYPELFAGKKTLIGRVEEVSRRNFELGQLLCYALRQKRLHFKPFPGAVTVHDSCHSTHIRGGSRWRELLNSIDRLELREMRDSDRCCGFGGSFSVFHRDEADEITKWKINRILETGAPQVLVGSPGCLIRLRSSLPEEFQGAVRFRHVVELLADLVV